MLNSGNHSPEKTISNRKLKASNHIISGKQENQSGLDQSTASYKTKNSAENEFNEISNLIKKKINHDNSMISKNSKQHTLNADSSVISCLDNWIGNVSLEDSRQFEENFSQIKTCKKSIPKTSKGLVPVNGKRNVNGLPNKVSKKTNEMILISSNGSKMHPEIESPEIKNCRNPDISHSKKVKEQNKPVLLNISDLNPEDENYTEELDEEVNLELGKKVSHYSTSKKIIASDLISNERLDTQLNISPFPVKFNTSPDEGMNYSKPNFKQFDFYQQFSMPFNIGNQKHEENVVYDIESNDNTDNLDYNVNSKSIMNNFKTFKSSFNGTLSTNNQFANKLTNVSLNNYTSNCSTNLTNRSNISNAIISLNTPKHQKITSDHNIMTKPSLNNPLSGVINQHNYSLLQSQTPHNNNEGFLNFKEERQAQNFNKTNKNLTPTSIYKSNDAKSLQSSVSNPSSTTNKTTSSMSGGISGLHFNPGNTFNKKNSMLGNYSSTFVCTQNSNNIGLLMNNMNSLFNYSQNTAPTSSITGLSDLKNIVVENIFSGKDKRTTIMLRNIPLKYNITNLSEELNQAFAGKFDFINMPLNLDTKLNYGYAFVNFTDPLHIVLFFETFQDRVWSRFKSEKKISINYAQKQGKKDPVTKDDTMYFTCKDTKVAHKLKTASIDIPFKYCELFKKILPHATIELPVSSLKGKGIPTFTVKKLF